MASINIPQGLNDILALTDVHPSNDSPSGNAPLRRIFIGPMPERVIAQTVDGQHKRAAAGLSIGSVFSLSQENAGRSSGDKTEEVTRVLRDNAFRFFLHDGGKADEWREDEEQEQDLVDELVRRWKRSEWGRLWERRQQGEPALGGGVPDKWFGASFEVGALLGVNVIHSSRHLDAFAVPLSSSPKETGVVTVEAGDPASSISRSDTDDGGVNGGEEGTLISREGLNPSFGDSSNPKRSADFSQADNSTFPGPDSDRRWSTEVKGKAKVHYMEPEDGVLDDVSGPAAPEDMPERTKAANTSLAPSALDTLKSPTPSEFSWGDIVLRGD
jgi:hypothetical protein